MKTTCADTELQIRNGSSLLVRELSWFIIYQKVTQPLLDWPIQEPLGLNSRELLAAAVAKCIGCVDAQKVLLANDNHHDGRVSRFTEGICQADVEGPEDSILMYSNDWQNIGQENGEKWKINPQ